MLAIVLYPQRHQPFPLTKTLKNLGIEVEEFVADAGAFRSETFAAAKIVIICINEKTSHLLEIITQLRVGGFLLPIVIMDEKFTSAHATDALSRGADRYFAKPFNLKLFANALKILVAKKEALLRNRWMRAYDIWLDIERRLAKRGESKIALRNKEFALLEFFMMHRGRVVSRNMIFEHLWDRNANFMSNTVDVHITRLRRKIDGPFKEKLIHTVHCVGYVFEKRKAKE